MKKMQLKISAMTVLFLTAQSSFAASAGFVCRTEFDSTKLTTHGVTSPTVEMIKRNTGGSILSGKYVNSAPMPSSPKLGDTYLGWDIAGQAFDGSEPTIEFIIYRITYVQYASGNLGPDYAGTVYYSVVRKFDDSGIARIDSPDLNLHVLCKKAELIL